MIFLQIALKCEPRLTFVIEITQALFVCGRRSTWQLVSHLVSFRGEIKLALLFHRCNNRNLFDDGQIKPGNALLFCGLLVSRRTAVRPRSFKICRPIP